MSEDFFIKEFPNGLTLLSQPMSAASSAALTILTPAGASHDPADAAGAASVAAEWHVRGAGDRDTRQLQDALDELGSHHSEAVQSEHMHFSSVQLGRNLADILAIYADILQRPQLTDASFQPSRALALQDLASLEDEPARKCNLLLMEKFFPYPLGRCIYGSQETLDALTADVVRRQISAHVSAANTILAVAGNVNWDELSALVERAFGDWPGQAGPTVSVTDQPAGITHIEKDTAQTHIALAHRSVPISHDQYYAARVAGTVLSGGMSGRLFTEVREKRGLVYHVSCRHQGLKDTAGMFTYAGTRPEVAQQTCDVTVNELRRLAEGVEEHELQRAKTQLKSALVMQGESTSARAAALAADWYHLGRLRSLREISKSIEQITARDVTRYAKDWPAETLTALVIGPQTISTE